MVLNLSVYTCTLYDDMHFVAYEGSVEGGTDEASLDSGYRCA